MCTELWFVSVRDGMRMRDVAFFDNLRVSLKQQPQTVFDTRAQRLKNPFPSSCALKP